MSTCHTHIFFHRCESIYVLLELMHCQKLYCKPIQRKENNNNSSNKCINHEICEFCSIWMANFSFMRFSFSFLFYYYYLKEENVRLVIESISKGFEFTWHCCGPCLVGDDVFGLGFLTFDIFWAATTFSFIFGCWLRFRLQLLILLLVDGNAVVVTVTIPFKLLVCIELLFDSLVAVIKI